MRNPTETSATWLLRIKEILASMPLSLKLVLLVLVTLMTRFIALIQTQIISSDGVRYVKAAKLFAEGQYSEVSDFSFYSLIISIIQKIIGDWVLSGELASVILSTLTIIPVFLLGKSMYGEKVGWLSAIFYLSLPNLLRFGSDILRDPTCWFFMVFTLYLVWNGIHKTSLLPFCLASVSAGLGALTRLEGVILWGALAIFLAFRRASKISFKRRGLNMALLILFSPLLLSLVLFTMKGLSSRLVLVDMASFPVNYIKGEVRNILQPKDPIDAMGQKTYDSLPIISQDSLELASRHRVVLAISEVFYKFIKSANLLIILIFLGLWERKKKGFEASDWYLLYTFAALVMMSILYARQLYYFSTRHGLTLVLPFVYFAGIGLVFSTEIVRRTLNRITPGWTVLKRYVFHILTFSLVIIFLVQGLSARRTEKVNFKEMGFWLKERGYQGSVIMGGKKFLRLVFYADGEFLEMPNSWEKVVESINKKNVRVVVIDSCTIEQDCPGFYKNWQRTGLFLLQETKGEEEKCAIQIYGIY